MKKAHTIRVAMLFVAVLAMSGTALFAQHSTGLAPGQGAQGPFLYPKPEVGPGLASNIYSVESLSFQFARIDVGAPGTIINIAPFNWIQFPGAGAFGSDPNVLYGIYETLLYSIDPTTGAHTLLGDLGTGTGFTGLSWDPVTGRFYGTTSACAGSSLYIVDVNTVTATFVGNIAGQDCVIAVGFAPDGTLYGYDIVLDQGIRIDKNTGVATVLGPIGFDANFGQGMDYDPNMGTMYLSAFNNATFQAELRSFNTATGSTTFLGKIGAPGVLTQFGYAGIVQDAGGGCQISLHAPEYVAPGGTVNFDLWLKHNRDATVHRSFFVRIEDKDGTVYASKNTSPRTIRYLDEVSVDGGIRVPQGLSPGKYRLVAGIEGMVQGTASTHVTFEVSDRILRADEANVAAVDAPLTVTTVPTEYALAQNYPNPFNPQTQIAYALPEGSFVTLKVYNMLGQEVESLVSAYQEAGRHQVTFDASALSAGVYLYVIEAGDFTATKRLTLLK